MRWRNGEHGYGIVTKVLHWSTVALLVTQLTVGYMMETDGDVPDVDCDPPGEDRSGGDTSDAEEEQYDRLEDRCEAAQYLREERADDAVGAAWSDLWSGDLADGELSLAGWHVLLGLAIVAVGVLRVVWRRTTPLPPWDVRLTATDRTVLHRVERVLLALLFVVPATGIALVVGSDDLVPLHIAAHLCFYAALAVHLFVVLRRRVVGRMLWGRPAGR
ncbi:cytochrome b561 [Promicromonospora sp. AC04]|uniref:cytochrome b n=1 Tax=Promicromonospora sp. AC04 TaxID=2135723 RepID=UPI000D3D6F66|nr:cytochrome b/b6 domain-containing protein [Promicromonospora sp. AC04]PUB23573.1 cytochrome b561 [Promicromonospora sp. AC04]